MDAPLTLRDFFDQVYRPRRLIGCSATTPRKYRTIINLFGKHLGRVAMLSDLLENTISPFLCEYSQNHAPDTLRSAQSHLMALANYAVKKGMLREVPDLLPIHPPRKIPTAYTPDEIARLIAAAREVPGDIDGIPCSLYWPALFLVAYDTGARKGAIIALEWADFKPEGPFLLFRAEHSKQNADQLLKIAAETAKAIEAIRRPEGKIFPWPYCEALIYFRLKKIFKAAGLPFGRHDLLHKIRRTCATLAHNNGADATMQLGHSSDAITRKHYLATSATIQAADVLPRPGGASSTTPPAQHNPIADDLRRQASELNALADKIDGKSAA